MKSGRTLITPDQASTLIAAFLHERASVIADTTVATYARKLATFHEWGQQHEPTLPASETWATRYACWLATPGTRSKASQGLHLSAVRQWGCFLLAAGHLSVNPFAAVSGPPQPTSGISRNTERKAVCCCCTAKAKPNRSPSWFDRISAPSSGRISGSDILTATSRHKIRCSRIIIRIPEGSA